MDALLILFSQPSTWVALVSLIVMEIVLGIDNLVFISILTNKLPEGQRARARRLGIGLALVFRLVLLAGIAWVVQLDQPFMEIFSQPLSIKDLILIAGGLFLVWKATTEIHHNVDPHGDNDVFDSPASMAFGAVIAQILLLDLVFSIDSIITAVGMTNHLPIMIVAVVVAVGVMLLAATPLANFVQANPTVVMLALGFLLMIGMTLIAEGLGAHVPKGYIYAAMAFSALVEGLNMLRRRRVKSKSEG
ncbi:TerC family protein [Abyssibius alkaniclasticus]|uniref:TerC family protein n=1 Tax=Abyssibius alkaniclasticus TaxID=2881234 RepID=UPI002363E132|nr:TerC family protein [Abyssibius alkaniclasticus]UPH72152.1 TerC family protein [Abyssibius alkaniclasticus]|tara:strand:- start:16 stop:756 length:741 start_codon:yes stop_codon:yes gene_type:complete